MNSKMEVQPLAETKAQLQNLFPALHESRFVLGWTYGILACGVLLHTPATLAAQTATQEPACAALLEPTTPDELKELRACAKAQREERLRTRQEQVRLLRTAGASNLSQELGGPAGDAAPAASNNATPPESTPN